MMPGDTRFNGDEELRGDWLLRPPQIRQQPPESALRGEGAAVGFLGETW